MSLPTVTQTWTLSFNNRYMMGTTGTSASSLAAVVWSLKNFLKTTMGYTVKGSCDGVTGAMDGVDRWLTAANAQVRFNGAGGAQSWFVLTDGAGINWCLSFNSSLDEAYRLASSQGGNYVVAATANQQPTAVDECGPSLSSFWTGAGVAPVDRVWHLWGSADKKIFRMVICKSSQFVSCVGGEKFTSSLIAPATFTLATGGGTVGALLRYFQGSDTNSGGGGGGVAYGFTTYLNSTPSTTNPQIACRVFSGGADRQCNASQGIEGSGGAGLVVGFGTFYTANPALQGGPNSMVLPVTFGSGQANADGKLGTAIDQWYAFTGPNAGQPFGSMLGQKQFWVINPGMILVGDGITVMDIA